MKLMTRMTSCLGGVLLALGGTVYAQGQDASVPAAQEPEGTVKSASEAVAAAAAQGSATASATSECTMGAQVRLVEVAPGDGGEVGSCKVVYVKKTENPGVSQVLWTAKNDAPFCDAKAKEFVAKLAGMGWACSGALAP